MGRRIATVGPAEITAYVARRQGETASNGTINREFAVLNKMMRLAYENNKLLRLPVVRKLKEGAPSRDSSSVSNSKLSAVTCARTFKSLYQLRTPSGGECRVKS